MKQHTWWWLLIGWALVALSALFVWALIRSPWGRVLKSIREVQLHGHVLRTRLRQPLQRVFIALFALTKEHKLRVKIPDEPGVENEIEAFLGDHASGHREQWCAPALG